MALTNKQKSLIKSSVQVKPSPAKTLMASKPAATISVPRGTCEKIKTTRTGDDVTIKLGCSSSTFSVAWGTPDCVAVNTCVNTQLALPNAGSLTNFAAAVISAYEAHIAAWGADPEFAGEVIATLQNSPAAINEVLNIVNTALATSPNPLLSNLCAYINDCIDNGLLTVSTDAWNLITTGTDGGAFLNEAALATAVDTLETLTTLVYSEPNATDGGLTYTDEDGTANFIKTSHTETVTPTVNTPLTITHNLNSTRVSLDAYSTATGMNVIIEYGNRTANTIDIISTTADPLEIVIQK